MTTRRRNEFACRLRRVALALALAFGVVEAAEEALPVEKAIEWSEPAPLAEHSLLLDATKAAKGLVVVGDRGHVLLSRPNESRWRQARVPSRSMLTAVAAVDKNVWAVGHDAVILHSSDAGETWVREHYAPEAESPLFDVWFADALRGLAVGAYGLALSTSDAGATWKRTTIDAQDRHLNAIAEARDGALFVAGEYGAVFRSRDRGASWEISNTPYSGSYFGVLALRDGAVLVYGLRGHLYRSIDGGTSWTPVETGTAATLQGGVEMPDGSVVVSGLSGTLLVSHDGGKSFAVRSLPDRRAIATLVPDGPGNLLLIGERGIDLLERKALGEIP